MGVFQTANNFLSQRLNLDVIAPCAREDLTPITSRITKLVYMGDLWAVKTAHYTLFSQVDV